ncbi:MAG: leucine-rich repeat protein [Ruminococcus sp.]|nr:leucine-rich repeat protein [Ruminococcus sp.]
MKKFVFFMLSLAVLSGTGTMSAFAADVITETFGDITIEISENGKYVRVYSAENNITAEYNNGSVQIDGKVIKSGTYNFTNEDLERLEKLDDITDIDPVEYMYFSDNVEEIECKFAPGLYPQLKLIDFGNSLEKIGDYAFEYSETDRIYFPDLLKEIGEGAFENCNNITSIVIPENVETIGDYAFMDCDLLDNVVILSRDAVFGEECFGYVYGFPDEEKADITIRGYKGSTAENYADENGFTFVALDESVIFYGDANCDGQVTIADATAIIQALGKPDEYTLSEQGEKNADCFHTGDGVTGKDAVVIQLIEAGLLDLSSLPVNDIDPSEI